MSQTQLLQLLYEKDCYIQALEKQLEFYKSEFNKENRLGQCLQKIQISQKSEDDIDLNYSQEQAISKSRILQFQSSDQKHKFISPLTNSNHQTTSRRSQYIQQKVIKDSMDIQNITLEEFNMEMLKQQMISISNENIKFYDDFYMCGLETKDYSIGQPRILYHSSSNFSNQIEQNNQLLKFMYPNGCEIKELSITDDIYQIIYQTINLDSKECFLLIMKQLETQITKYYICIRYEEYHYFPGSIYRSHKRIICISTQHYLIDFYFSMLIEILNQIKMRRMNQIKCQKQLSNIDGSQFDIQIQSIVQQKLTMIDRQNMNQKFEFNKQSFKMEIIENINWGLNNLMTKFTSQLLIRLFVSILIERSIVFISKQPNLLTAIILLCQRYLLKPFTWIHPVISILPQDYIQLLGSPVPIIIGLENNIQRVHQLNLIENNKNLIFVNLDSDKIEYYNTDNIPLISAELMQFLSRRIEQCQSNIFQQLNVFEQLLRIRVVQNLPQKPIYNFLSLQDSKRKSLLEYQKIADKTIENISNLGNSDKLLWKQFFQTQLFTQYVDQYYQQQ